ncbi:MAG: proprotein convertase P, partial [Thaumarchaeota archaeon]|nr:proprotein convertase P [Nitrososphaerota archaeon]
MKKGAILTVTIVISALMLSFIAFPLSATAQAPDFIPGKTQVVSAFGKVPGQDLIVHVLVLVPQGSDKNEIANEAVRQQGARPIDHSEFSLNGLNWPQTSPNTVLVTQNYNPADDPNKDELVTGEDALKKTHKTWTDVDSDLAFGVLGSTGRCPSLVRECPEKQTSDTFNDVGWLSLKNKNTLGVTWFNTKTVEADMVLNTKFNWQTDGMNNFDVE